jgi:hypothetical protein
MCVNGDVVTIKDRLPIQIIFKKMHIQITHTNEHKHD